MSHTPGPWGYIYDGSSDWSIGPIADPQGHKIANCWVPHYRETKTMVAGVAVADVPADVCLIAAAPELLEALRGIVEIGKRDMSNPKYDGYFESAKAAIAKAEGQS